jgi:hypothetical protein
MERCPNCGASIRTGARFCTACGFRLTQPEASEVAAAPAGVPAESSPSHGSTSGIQWNETGRTGVAAETSRPDLPDQDGGDVVSKDADAVLAGAADDFPASPNSDDPTLRTPQMGRPAEVDLAQVSSLPEEDRVATGPGPGVEAGRDGTAEGTARGTTIGDDLDVTPPAGVTGEGQFAGADGDDPATAAPAQETDDPTLEKSPLVGPEGETSSADDGARTTERSAPTDGASGGWTITVPAGGTTAEQDDVVIGSTVVRESSWPASEIQDVPESDLGTVDRSRLDDDLSFPNVANPATDITSNGDDHQLAEPIESDRNPGERPEDPPGPGKDVDWEPWGGGSVDESDRRTGTTSAVDDISSPLRANPSPYDEGSESTGFDRAQALLDELQSTFATLSVPREPEVDPGATHAMDQVDQVGQLLETWSGAPVDADRLAELKGLASDLEDRDYDIRALQRFSQERELILELAQLVEQQQDLIQQIRSTLRPSS